MKYVIAVVSAKGGSGKTTVSAVMATFLAEIGYNVSLVDCDETTSGLSLLYLGDISRYVALNKMDGPRVGLFESSQEPAMLSVIQLKERLCLIPSHLYFRSPNNESEDLALARIRHITRSLDFPVRNKYSKNDDHSDLIILDVEAGAEPLMLHLIDPSCSDLVVIVSEYDPMSAAGVERIKSLSPSGFEFSRTRLLLNKILPEFVDKFSEFFSIANYLPPLQWDADVVRAYARRSLALDLNEGNSYTLSVFNMLRSLPVPGIEQRLADWSESKVVTLSQPIDMQIESLNDEIVRIQKKMAERERQRLYLSLILGGTVASAIGLLSMYLLMPQSSSDYLKGILAAFALFVALFLVGFFSKLVPLSLGFRSSEDQIEKRMLERLVDKQYDLINVRQGGLTAIMKSSRSG